MTTADLERPTSTLGRLHSLDILRGVAILMVLVVHTPLPYSLNGFLSTTHIGQAIYRGIKLGSFGVDLFFVLSGFLISSLLFSELSRTGRLRVIRFWIRRSFKIWPSYFVAYGSVILIFCSYDFVTRRNPWHRLSSQLPNFFFIQNYFPLDRQWFASWSLAVEEHFYCILPLALLAVIAINARRFIPVGCSAICIV